MKDTFISARLVEPNLIRVMLFTTAISETINAFLSVDSKLNIPLIPSKRSSMNGMTILDYRLKENLVLGHSYQLFLSSFGATSLDVSEATTFKGFDEEFFYDGELGYRYNKKSTSFALWAPLASVAYLKIRKDESSPWEIHELIRGEKGVYKLELLGDYNLFQYLFVVTNSGNTFETNDPYAKCSAANGEYSLVYDFSSLDASLNIASLPPFDSPSKAIIYEGHVRDLTSDPNTDIVHKGTFLGLAEKGRKTKGGHPAGFDYLKSLGFTHLQLLPIFDYKTVDEKNPSSKYNWGYDPAQYFVPEGSFASDPLDPSSRIKDLKAMVSSFHEAGIRIVMDVVWNHVYEYETSIFERIVPNYFFRMKADGRLSNCSGCGNDLASERPMVRKMILDASKWWISTYGIDGFRFDLMGLIDVETLKEIEKMAKSLRPDFLLYGEGWNMADTPFPLGKVENASKLAGYSFFNDTFRENVKAYWAGETYSQQAFKSVMAGMCLDFILPKKFVDASQSINYVECHDNETYFDYLTKRYKDMGENEKIERCKGALASVLLSFGIPFIHAGEEIFLSKGGLDNTYKAGDDVNRFPYDKLDEYYPLVDYFRNLIAIRKKIHSFSTHEPKKLDVAVDILDIGEGVRVDFLDKKAIKPYRELSILFNPTNLDIELPMPQSVSVLFDGKGNSDSPKYAKEVLPPRSVIFVGK